MKSIKKNNHLPVQTTEGRRALATSSAHILFAPRGFAQRLTDIIAADPARAVAISLLMTAFISVAVNALFMQTIKHPAPLFGTAYVTSGTPRPLPEPAPVPVPRSTAFSSALAELDETAVDRSGMIAPAAQPPKPETIGDLLTAPSVKPANPVNKTVLAAQRALNKLGYVVKVDGVSGGTTRQAIERFERDSRLPVKGDLTPKLQRELSMAAGMPVE